MSCASLKKGGSMRERRHQSNMCDWSRKDKSDRAQGKCVLCVAYRCKATRAISIQSERSTFVATNNGPYAPVCIYQIRVNIFSPTNKQVTNQQSRETGGFKAPCVKYLQCQRSHGHTINNNQEQQLLRYTMPTLSQ